MRHLGALADMGLAKRQYLLFFNGISQVIQVLRLQEGGQGASQYDWNIQDHMQVMEHAGQMIQENFKPLCILRIPCALLLKEILKIEDKDPWKICFSQGFMSI